MHTVRPAGATDVPFLARGVAELIAEIRGAAAEPADDGALAVAQDLVAGRLDGAALVAWSPDGRRHGLITANRLRSIRTRGPYALIQELWVAPEGRALGVGAALISALCNWARSAGCAMVEVGLPLPQSPVHANTYHRYTQWGFTANGPRMRKIVRTNDDPDRR
ncbi:GNAT family N-acetyltransferase [Streptomyces sp. NPDC051940]|uniref:GNAT family N-acetyltransferase n=1 Tax=Streptomyces sp. NPDC051940 TaxID=3155675 RepID=UPI0034480990